MRESYLEYIWGYKLYPSTAFIFQLGAEVLGGESVESSLFTELWNSK